MNETILRKVAEQMGASVESPFEADDYDKDPPVLIAPKGSVVQFKIQNGPIKEVGKNGCQVDDIILFSRRLIEEFNAEFPCDENVQAIVHLNTALAHLKQRRIDRENRGVEGRNEA